MTGAVFGATVVCDLCGRESSGGYYAGPGNTVYCADCYSRYSVCSGCGKLTKSAIRVGEISFCADCYIKLGKCALCGRAITGGYSSYPDLGIDICLSCESKSPRCLECGIPVKSSEAIGNSGLCDRCVAGAQRCYSCRGIILKNYNYFEGDQSRKFCSNCVARYQACADCGAPSGPGGTKLDDGLNLCGDCRSEALFQPESVTPVKDMALRFLEGDMGMTIKHPIDYSLRDSKFLQDKGKSSNKDLNGLFYRIGDKFYIYVRYGLRKKDLIWVLAHEITHAWQAENCDNNASLSDREGFAQWTAYYALRYYGYDSFAANMTEGSSVYSNGLNKMLEIESRAGRKAVFDYMKNQ